MEKVEDYEEIDESDVHALEAYQMGEADKIYFKKQDKSPVSEENSGVRQSDSRLETMPFLKREISFARIYDNHPSEVISVPRRKEIRAKLARLLRKSDGKVPETFKDWSVKQCYAVYFKEMGVEKYDPAKHD
jgi:hypothetical protein